LKKNIIVVPSVEKGKGGGHLTRSIKLINELREIGVKAQLYLPCGTETGQFVKIFESMNFNQSWLIFDEEIKIRCEELKDSIESEINLIILDRFQTLLEELNRWKKIAPVIGIDEGGKFRDNFDFLIDILIPPNIIKPNPNILFFTTNEHELTRKNEYNQSSISYTLKILITFGQEDTAGLGLKTLQKLLSIKTNQPIEITLLKGNLNTSILSFAIPENVKILESIPNLAESLCEYDLVITHYGLTAYEAFFAGVPVLLAHPTKYHKKLAKAAGFLDFNKKYREFSLAETQSRRGRILDIKLQKKLCVFASSRDELSLVNLISSFSPIINRSCPVCESNTGKSITRFRDRTYRKCVKCGIIYMDRINSAPIEYEKEYFFENYKKQYGKTYLEDFENIKNASKRRLKIIKTLKNLRVLCASVPPCDEFCIPTLLDIGCAYGPFLKAAQEEGFDPFGIDPAEDAVRYVNEELKIPAVHGFFPNIELSTPGNKTYDIITLWFVIEHFTNCVMVLKEIKKLLKPNGILAFSTPSFSGISGCSNLNKFLFNSPADHFTIWSPKMCKKALMLAGFKVKKIVVVGHHPERFPLLGRFAKNKIVIYFILLGISKLFKLGDTFEVYAQLKE